MPEDIEAFFFDVVRRTIEYREKNKDVKRKDFMQLLIQLKNQGYVSVDKTDEDQLSEKQSGNKKLTFNEVAAQAFIFFIAGFETSSSTLNFTLIELSKNPKIQQKVHEEIDKALKGGEVSYEAMNDLKYLDMCIDETLRKYPIVPILNREVSKDYSFAGSGLTIDKGTGIFIPVLGIHRNPDIYENPLEFKPERFLNSPTGNEYGKGLTYFAFGDGPRNCIGSRMGKLQVKIGLFSVLSKFSIELVDKSLITKEVEFDVTQFLLVPKNSIMMKVTPRNQK